VPPRPLASTAVLAAALLTVAGCASGAPSATGGASPTTTASSPVSTPSAAAPSATATAPPSPTGTPAAPARTKAALTAALLVLDDLPTGFQEEDAEDGGPAPRASSSQARCASLVRLTNTVTLPGTKISVTAAFSGGQSGPFIEEHLDALGSSKAATSVVRSYVAAVKACRSLRLTVAGAGTSTVAVRAVRAPDVPGATAARFTAGNGPLEGLEVTQVIVPVDDVVLSMTFTDATPEDVEGASGLAVEKAVEILGGGGAA